MLDDKLFVILVSDNTDLSIMGCALLLSPQAAYMRVGTACLSPDCSNGPSELACKVMRDHCPDKHTSHIIDSMQCLPLNSFELATVDLFLCTQMSEVEGVAELGVDPRKISLLGGETGVSYPKPDLKSHKAAAQALHSSIHELLPSILDLRDQINLSPASSR